MRHSKIKLINKDPFILFEIPNFLDDKTYESLDKSFPKFDTKNLRDDDDIRKSINININII